jgi:hypothetical protein
VREADCGERAEDEQDCRDEPHRRRIGSGSDGLDGLTAGDRADDPHLGALRKRLVEQTAAAHVDAVDVDVDQAAELTALVEEQVPHRQLPQSLADRSCVELEALLAARLRGEHRGQQDDRH